MSDYQCSSCGGICKKSGCERADVPAKTLTDEEIVSLYESSYLESGLDEWEFDPVYFARAILKKVSEK